MWPRTRFSKKTLLLLVGDVLLLYAALASVLYLRYYKIWDPPLIEGHLIPFSITFAIWILIFGSFGLYDLRFMKNSKRFLYRLIHATAANTVLAIILFYLLPIFTIEPRRNLLLIAVFTVIYIFLWRYLFNLIIIRAPSSKVLFFGVTQDAVDLADFLLKNPQLGQQPTAFLSANGELEKSVLPLPIFTSADNLKHIVSDFGIDTIVVLREIKENKAFVNALFQVIPRGIAVVEFSSFHEMFTGKIPLSLIGEVWFLENLVGIRKTGYEFFKRTGDLVFALVTSVLAIALFPLIAFCIAIDSPGPIFYRQKRVGRNGKEFWLLKYRTMVKDAEKMGGLKMKLHGQANDIFASTAKPTGLPVERNPAPKTITHPQAEPWSSGAWKNGQDTRHTRVGRFLRKSYLDELPQIWNILKGEMSFVGPRPERPEYVAKLKQKIPFYEMRLLVPPGITGFAQINMENDASVEDAPVKMQYDLYYIKNRSSLLDLLIILKTIFIILRREGR